MIITLSIFHLSGKNDKSTGDVKRMSLQPWGDIQAMLRHIDTHRVSKTGVIALNGIYYGLTMCI